jgi:hypothetical protein
MFNPRQDTEAGQEPLAPSHDRRSASPPEIEKIHGVPPVVTKITVALVEEAEEALEQAKESTKRSKTDIVNKALVLYGFVNSELRSGSELVLKRPTGETLLVQLL